MEDLYEKVLASLQEEDKEKTLDICITALEEKDSDNEDMTLELLKDLGLSENSLKRKTA